MAINSNTTYDYEIHAFLIGFMRLVLQLLYMKMLDILSLIYLLVWLTQDAVQQASLIIVYFSGNDSVDLHPSGLGPHVPLPEYIENIKRMATYL